MNQPTWIGKYPARFWEISGEFAAKRKLTLTCESEAEARRTRLRLYGFQRAIRKEGGSTLTDNSAIVVAMVQLKGRVLTLTHPDDWANRIKIK